MEVVMGHCFPQHTQGFPVVQGAMYKGERAPDTAVALRSVREKENYSSVRSYEPGPGKALSHHPKQLVTLKDQRFSSDARKQSTPETEEPTLQKKESQSSEGRKQVSPNTDEATVDKKESPSNDKPKMQSILRRTHSTTSPEERETSDSTESSDCKGGVDSGGERELSWGKRAWEITQRRKAQMREEFFKVPYEECNREAARSLGGRLHKSEPRLHTLGKERKKRNSLSYKRRVHFDLDYEDEEDRKPLRSRSKSFEAPDPVRKVVVSIYSIDNKPKSVIQPDSLMYIDAAGGTHSPAARARSARPTDLDSLQQASASVADGQQQHRPTEETDTTTDRTARREIQVVTPTTTTTPVEGASAPTRSYVHTTPAPQTCHSSPLSPSQEPTFIPRHSPLSPLQGVPSNAATHSPCPPHIASQPASVPSRSSSHISEQLKHAAVPSQPSSHVSDPPKPTPASPQPSSHVSDPPKPTPASPQPSSHVSDPPKPKPASPKPSSHVSGQTKPAPAPSRLSSHASGQTKPAPALSQPSHYASELPKPDSPPVPAPRSRLKSQSLKAAQPTQRSTHQSTHQLTHHLAPRPSPPRPDHLNLGLPSSVRAAIQVITPANTFVHPQRPASTQTDRTSPPAPSTVTPTAAFSKSATFPASNTPVVPPVPPSAPESPGNSPNMPSSAPVPMPRKRVSVSQQTPTPEQSPHHHNTTTTANNNINRSSARFLGSVGSQTAKGKIISRAGGFGGSGRQVNKRQEVAGVTNNNINSSTHARTTFLGSMDSQTGKNKVTNTNGAYTLNANPINKIEEEFPNTDTVHPEMEENEASSKKTGLDRENSVNILMTKGESYATHNIVISTHTSSARPSVTVRKVFIPASAPSRSSPSPTPSCASSSCSFGSSGSSSGCYSGSPSPTPTPSPTRIRASCTPTDL